MAQRTIQPRTRKGTPWGRANRKWFMVHALPALATPSLPAVAEAIGSSTAVALKDPIGQSDATSKALGCP